MAQLAGSVGGAAIGQALIPIPGVGAMIGSAIGSAIGYYVDQSGILDWWYPYKVLKNMVTPDPIQGPRVDDLRVTTASEGSARNFVVGPAARCNATLIWATALREEKDTQGSKGGGGAEYVEYKYYSNCAYYICDGPVKEVNRIWADGKTIYAKNTAVDIDDISATGLGKIVSLSNYRKVYQRLWIRTDQNVSLEDELNTIQPGQKIKLTNYAFPVGHSYTPEQLAYFEQEHEVWKSYDCGDDSGQVGYKLLYVQVFEGNDTEWSALQTQLGGAGKMPYWDEGGTEVTFDIFQAISLYNGKVAKSISVKLGGPNQLPDSLISSIEGDDTPAFRGSCYVRFTDLYVGDFGNRPPMIEALVNSGKGSTVASALRRICVDYAKIPDGLVSIHSSVTGDFAGMNIEGHVGLSEALAPMMAVYNLMPYDVAGVLTWRSRLSPLTYDVTSVAYPGLRLKRSSTKDAPTTLVVSFIDADHGYQKATRRARLNDVKNNVTDTITTGMVLTGTQAYEIAYRMIWDVHQSGESYSLTLPPSQMHVDTGDLITFDGLGNSWQGSVIELEQGADMSIELSAKAEDLEVLNQSYIAALLGDDPPETYKMEGDDFYADPVMWDVIDVGPLIDEHVGVAGVYFAACGSNRKFKGAAIFESSDGGRTYAEIGRITRSAMMGVVVSKTAYSGNAHGFDTTSTITVEMLDGVPESVEVESMLAGRNTWYSHGEVFGVANCTLVSRNTYEFSTMMRGLRGTEASVDALSVGDIVINLSIQGLHFQRLNPTAIKTRRFYKVIGAGGVLDLITPVGVTLNGGTLLSPSVYNVRGTRDAVNNITVTWLPRGYEIGRNTQGRRSMNERYTIAVPAREVRVDAARTWTYTAAQQILDGRTPADPLTLTIYQMTDMIGRGRPRSATI